MSSAFIYLKRIHEVRRMVATGHEIFMNKVFRKLSFSESIIARTLNRLPRTSFDFKAF